MNNWGAQQGEAIPVVWVKQGVTGGVHPLGWMGMADREVVHQTRVSSIWAATSRLLCGINWSDVWALL